jgi:nitrate/TMAO reductase-like tetraheme cytochrome c subunit
VPSRLAALSRHPLAIVGVILTTVAASIFLALVVAALAGLLRNPYAGLVVFVALPALFVAGLVMIAAGAWLERRREARGGAREWPVIDLGRPSVRRTTLAIIALTGVNLAILLIAGYGALHWMESPQFCGQVCHTPMHPQYTAWSASSHAEITCVSCHIGEGARSFVHAKLAGVRQLWHVTTGSYPRPIPAVAPGLPAAQETRATCHHATRNRGVLTKTLREFGEDEANTETKTTLQMHVGSPGEKTATGRAIHWHADPLVKVEYVASDAERQTIPYVKVTDRSGATREFVAEGSTAAAFTTAERRVMDCADCHNGVGHPFAPTVQKAVDRAIASGQVDAALPFIRREAVRTLSAEYPSAEAAEAAIERELKAFYQAEGRVADASKLERAVGALRATYRHNVFPAMKITWGTYPNNLGHMTSNGCFRCHDGRKSSDGRELSADCEFCHVQVE